MNYYLTDIDFELTQMYYSLIANDQKYFLNWVVNSKYNSSSPMYTSGPWPYSLSMIGNVIIPNADEKYFDPAKSISSLAFSNYIKEKNYKFSTEEFDIINKIFVQFTEQNYKPFTGYYSGGESLSFISANGNGGDVIIFISSEPNWKNLKNQFIDFIKSKIQFIGRSTQFENFWNDYFKYLDHLFKEYTPIDKKFKVNLKFLKSISYNREDSITKNTIKSLILWKEFLSEINAEKNVESVEYIHNPTDQLIEKLKETFPYVITRLEHRKTGELTDTMNSVPMDIMIYKNGKFYKYFSIKLSNWKRLIKKPNIIEVYGVKLKK